MKNLAKVVQLTLTVLILILSSPPAKSANSKAADAVVFDFLHQYIDHATPPDLPMNVRIVAAVSAASNLASTLGSEIDALTLMKQANNPTAFAPASETTYAWVSSAWSPDTRSTYTYAGGKQSSMMSEEYSGAVWQKRTNFVYSYDGSGNLSTYRLQNWTGTVWEDAFRYTMTYSGALPIEAITEHWNGSAWDNYSRSVNTYDGSSRLTTVKSYSWADPDWMETTKITNTYDGAGDMTVSLSQLALGFTYLNQVQTLYVYDGSHHPTSATTQNWNIAFSAWDNHRKFEYVYNGLGNRTLSRESSWISSAWLATDVDTIKYNGLNQNSQSVYWDITNNLLTRDDLSYDGSGNLIEVISSEFFGSWLPTDRYVWVYTSVAVKVDDAPLPADFVLMQNHPNPFNPTTTIRYSLARPQLVQIEVFNILGQLVRTLEDSYQGVGTYETNWDGNDSGGRGVASGVYFYRLRAGEFVQTRKMVLSR